MMALCGGFCVYAAPPGFCAGAIFAVYFIFLNVRSVVIVCSGGGM